MSRTIQSLIGRAQDADYIRRSVALGECCSIVGTSNLGKSALLRFLGDSPSPNRASYIYVDCNQMADRSARALFAVIWRALDARLQKGIADVPEAARLKHWSAIIIQATSFLAAQSAFEDAISFALETLPHPLTLCLDEFDQVYQQCEPQAFLNLRALYDLHAGSLLYVTATERELSHLTTTREQSEFYELVMPHVRFISFWTADDSRMFCEEWAEREGAHLLPTDFDFIYRQAGGHPGLTQAVCHHLAALDAERAVVPAGDLLSGDENILSECKKIWDDLEADEREVLLNLSTTRRSSRAWEELQNKSILRPGDLPQLFGKLFEDFIERQRENEPNRRGVRVDADAGTVRVDGREIEGLSELEYRLLQFLHARADRISDKYAIVESVWGQEYIDKVDDSRIEKLMSRLRQKIEPDPAHPRYLVSVRGRGYKLTR